MDLAKIVHTLWMQHSEWTRMAFTSIIFNNPDQEAVIARLLRNPVDFYNLLRKFYGERIALEFKNLLTEHLILAGDLVKATLSGDTNKAEYINYRLYRNVDEISCLLASVNPYWDYNKWRNMLYMHLDLAKKMAQEMIDGNFKESINTYDKFEKEVMIMADMMADGLIYQMR